ncbi:MAG: hypothetical protein RR365_15025, partial [Bacteroides sp.]
MDDQKLEELKAKGKIANQWANNAAEGIMRQMNITRMRLNISAPDFAEIIGMPSKHSLYSVYNREGRTVHLKQFLAFCRVFGYDIETTTNRSAAEEEIDSAVFESVGALSALSGKALHKIAAFVTDLEGVDTYDKRRVSMCLHALANATSAEDEKQEICTPEKTWEDIQKNAKD